MIITGRVNITLNKATNYLILGNWSDKISYKLSDAGIPVVKVPDSTSLGYSVYALNVNESTVGASPSGAGFNEWRLIESAEFIYMQQAYIERLQAAIVTAERIEALMIRTSKLEVLEGAKIGAFDIGESYLGAGGTDSGGSNGMSLWVDFIVFNQPGKQALIGATQSLGFEYLGNFSDTRSADENGNPIAYKTGVIFNVKNAQINNTAIALAGGHISGLALRTRTTSTGITLTRDDVVVVAYNSSAITIYLNSNPEIGEIKYIPVVNNVRVLVSGNSSHPIKIGSGGSSVTSISIGGGDAEQKGSKAFLWDGQFWQMWSI
jgi:hypothetical protein